MEDSGEWVQDGHYPECCKAAESVISLGQLKIKARGQNLTCERMHGTSTHNQCHRQMEQNKTASFTGSRRNHRSTEKPLHCAIPYYHAIIQSKILHTPFEIRHTKMHKCIPRKHFTSRLCVCISLMQAIYWSWCNLWLPADLQRPHCKDCSILQFCITQHQKDQAFSNGACRTTYCPGPCHF